MQLRLPTQRAVIQAGADDFKFVRHLARLHANAVGFIPDAGLEIYCERGDAHIAFENDEPAGYLLGRPHLRWNTHIAPITQAAICFDAQRRHHGMSLVNRLSNLACIRGQLAIQAICRGDLDANLFWKAAGFIAIGKLHPWTARQKPLIVWRRLLTHTEPAWFRFMPPVAGYKAAKTI